MRENLSLALSDALDNQIVNGDRPDSPSGDQVAQLEGVFLEADGPDRPDRRCRFRRFRSVSRGRRRWSVGQHHQRRVNRGAVPLPIVLASKTFQSATNYKGEMSAAAYAMGHTGGFWTNKRMPAAASTIQPAILYRMGRSMMGGAGAMRTAVCPHWNEVGIDDIYSGSAKGERYFTLHVLIGDVIIVQPDAYAQLSFQSGVRSGKNDPGNHRLMVERRCVERMLAPKGREIRGVSSCPTASARATGRSDSSPVHFCLTVTCGSTWTTIKRALWRGLGAGLTFENTPAALTMRAALPRIPAADLALAGVRSGRRAGDFGRV